VVLSAGYALTMFDYTESIGHGAAISMGLLLNRYLELDLSVYLFQSFDMDIQGHDVTLERWPVRLGAAGILPLGRLELGLLVGVLADISNLRGLSPDEQPVGHNSLKFAFSPALMIRWHFERRIALFGSMGVEIFSRDWNYKWGEETRLKYRQIQPSLTIGLSFSVLP
jgi:hypothetical protein